MISDHRKIVSVSWDNDGADKTYVVVLSTGEVYGIYKGAFRDWGQWYKIDFPELPREKA